MAVEGKRRPSKDEELAEERAEVFRLCGWMCLVLRWSDASLTEEFKFSEGSIAGLGGSVAYEEMMMQAH